MTMTARPGPPSLNQAPPSPLNARRLDHASAHLPGHIARTPSHASRACRPICSNAARNDLSTTAILKKPQCVAFNDSRYATASFNDSR